MPEGPEVHHYADYINGLFENEKLTKCEIVGGRYNVSPFDGFDQLQSLLPLTLTTVRANGKVLYFILSGENGTKYALKSHLGMTGFWISEYELFSNKLNKKTTDLANKHVHIKLYFEKDNLWYVDYRSIGTMQFIHEHEITTVLDPLDIKSFGRTLDKGIEYNINTQFFIHAKKIQNKRICEVLVDQSVISGIGNYLRADILYYAAINPIKKVKDLTKAELKALFRSIGCIMWFYYNYEEGIAKGFITTEDFEKLKVMTGNNFRNQTHGFYLSDNNTYLIYGRDKDYKGNDVKTVSISSRTLYYVDAIQK